MKSRQFSQTARKKRAHGGAPAREPARRPLRHRVETGAYAALFFLVALVFSTGLQVQFSLPKMVVIRAGAALLAGFWLYRLARHEVQRLPRAVVVAALTLGLWWVVTTVFAEHRPTAIHGAHGRYNGLANQLLFLFLFLIAASSRFGAADVERLIKWLVVALVPVSVYALLQYAGWDPIRWPGERSASTLGNPVILGATLSLAMPFALVFALLAPRSGERQLWAVVLASLLAASYTTLSRGPLVAGVVAMFMVLGALAWEQRRRLTRTAVVIALIFAVPVLVVGYRQVVQVREKMAGSEVDRTLLDRLNTYRAAIQIVRDRPVVGVGLENFGVVYPRYRAAASEQLTPDVLPTMVHSGYLQAAATTGIPGLLAYLALVSSVLWVLVTMYMRAADRRARWLTVAFIASISAYLIQDLTGWQELSLSAYFWIILGLGLARACEPLETVTARAPFGWPAYAAVGVAMAIAIALTAESVALVHADHLFRRADTLSVRDQWAQLETDLTTALAYTSRAAYVDKAGVRYAERFAASGDAAAYRKSVELFQRAHRLDPFNPYFLIHRLGVDGMARQKKIPYDAVETEKLVSLLLDLDRNNATVHETIARLRLAEGRIPEALELAETAKRLRPGRGKFLTLEGDIRRAANDKAGAISAYERSIPLQSPDDVEWLLTHHKLIVTLIDVGRYQRAVETAQQLTALKPADGTGYTLLGFAYLQMRDFASAKQAFRTALTVNPNDANAKQGLLEAEASLKGSG